MKKVLLSMSLLLMTSVLAYSHSVGIGMYIPLGGSIPTFYPNGGTDPYLTFSPKSAFEVGIVFQPRVSFKIDNKGYNYISLAVDFGWYRDTFKFQQNSSTYMHQFDTLMTGLSIEWRPSLFMLGVGGGVKIPFTGEYSENGNGIKLSSTSVKSRFDNTLLPYVKLYAGVHMVFVSLALYVNFDIPYIQTKDNLGSLGAGYMYPGKLASVDIGAQIGLHLDFFNFAEE